MKIFFYAMTSVLLCMPFFSEAQDIQSAPADNVTPVESFFADGVYFTLADLQHHKPSVGRDQLAKSDNDNSVSVLANGLLLKTSFTSTTGV